MKALYRRAQARIELGKLDEANSGTHPCSILLRLDTGAESSRLAFSCKDLIDALKIEPGNTAVEAEMDRVNKLLSAPRKNKPALLQVPS